MVNYSYIVLCKLHDFPCDLNLIMTFHLFLDFSRSITPPNRESANFSLIVL